MKRGDPENAAIVLVALLAMVVLMVAGCAPKGGSVGEFVVVRQKSPANLVNYTLFALLMSAAVAGLFIWALCQGG